MKIQSLSGISSPTRGGKILPIEPIQGRPSQTTQDKGDKPKESFESVLLRVAEKLQKEI